MASRARETAVRWTQPRCLQCGHPAEEPSGRRDSFAASVHGWDDLGEPGDRCDYCGCDFTARPPRSYAQLEGLSASHLQQGLRARRRRASWGASWWGVVVLLGLLAAVVIAAAVEG
jgi:hypothetical protein